MSTQLLMECLDQLERLSMEADLEEFRKYFVLQKSRLLESPAVARGLVDLVMQENHARENEKERSLELLGYLLAEARIGMENDSTHGKDFLEAVESAAKAGLASGAMKPNHVMLIARLYRREGLPVPQEFMLIPDDIDPLPDEGADQLFESLEKFVREGLEEGGTAYELFNALDGTMATIPDKVQAALFRRVATMKDPAFERCALYKLLSGSRPVRDAAMAGLYERNEASALTRSAIALLPAIRGCLDDGALRLAVDELISKARGAASVRTDAANLASIEKIFATVTDGSGSLSIAVLLDREDDVSLAMILLKKGYGVKDAYVAPPDESAHSKEIIEQLRDQIGGGEISLETLRALLQDALADGLETGHGPAPGFLDVVEACNLFDLRPQSLDIGKLLDLADPESRIQGASPPILGRWIHDFITLERLSPSADTWFEDTEESREAVATGKTDKGIESEIWKLLEGRRDFWARLFLQTAVVLQDEERHRERRTLAATAYGLTTGRPLKRIPAMEKIMFSTIDVAHYRMR